jgi:hypothetical protein
VAIGVEALRPSTSGSRPGSKQASKTRTVTWFVNLVQSPEPHIIRTTLSCLAIG